MTITNFPRDIFLGYDTLFDTLNRIDEVKSKQPSYPPYNIIQKETHHYLIEIAVAGFTKDDIDITLENGKLTVDGKKKEDSENYIHKGISAKGFRRYFKLADTVEVVGADVVNGMLYVGLHNVIPEEELPKSIKLGEFDPLHKSLLLK
jgi:molecular chaperone IbpA